MKPKKTPKPLLIVMIVIMSSLLALVIRFLWVVDFDSAIGRILTDNTPHDGTMVDIENHVDDLGESVYSDKSD